MVALKLLTLPHLQHYWIQQLSVMLASEMILLALFTEQFWKTPEDAMGHWVTLTSYGEFLFTLAFLVD